MKIRDLKGQRALVTGGTSGIGRATAEALAREGARVLISGRSEARGAEVIAAIKAAGGEAEFVRADLESVQRCARTCRARRRGGHPRQQRRRLSSRGNPRTFRGGV